MIFHSYVSLPEGTTHRTVMLRMALGLFHHWYTINWRWGLRRLRSAICSAAWAFFLSPTQRWVGTAQDYVPHKVSFFHFFHIICKPPHTWMSTSCTSNKHDQPSVGPLVPVMTSQAGHDVSVRSFQPCSRCVCNASPSLHHCTAWPEDQGHQNGAWAWCGVWVKSRVA